MTWYTAFYGSYREKDGFHHIEGTFSRKEIFEKAQATANETGKIVTVSAERGSVNGIIHNFFKVNPDR